MGREKRQTRAVKVGDVVIGGGAPVSIQSMTKTPTADVRATTNQIRRLAACGCEIVRVAVRDVRDAEAIRSIVKKSRIPLVADIHFDHRLALKAIEAGADKIRINPGNMADREGIISVVKAAKRRRIPIRIGVNSGSVRKRHKDTRLPARVLTAGGQAKTHRHPPARTGPYSRRAGKDMRTADELVGTARRCIRLFEDLDFHDIVISVKASDVVSTVGAYRAIARSCAYPLHLGVTACGPPTEGIVKSSIALGALLLDGIGDTVRVSLTASPEEEVMAARRILSALGLWRFGPEIISCPTCGRCRVDLVGIVQKLEQELSEDTRHKTQDTGKKGRVSCLVSRESRPLKIAVMGCEVNGPGEAREADIGMAAGAGCAVLFRNGAIIRRVAEKDLVSVLMREVRSLDAKSTR